MEKDSSEQILVKIYDALVTINNNIMGIYEHECAMRAMTQNPPVETVQKPKTNNNKGVADIIPISKYRK